jgi:hypothetical protein
VARGTKYAQPLLSGAFAAQGYWDWSRWSVSVQDMGLTEGEVTLHLLPLAAESTIWVPEPAQARRDSAGGLLLALDSVRVVSRGPWREVRGTG